MTKSNVAAVALLIAAAVAVLESQPAARQLPGPLPGGGTLLHNGWKISPAGRQVPLDTLPMSAALSPDGKFLLVLNGGYNPPSVSVLSVAAGKELSRVRVDDGWLGLTFSPNGRLVYVGGGSRASVFEFAFSPAGKLEPRRTFPIVEEAKRVWQDFTGDVTFSPDGRLLYAALLYRDQVAVINPQSGRVIDRFATGRRPYRILFHPDGKSYFVTSWADGTVSQYETANGNRLNFLRLGPHPTDMVWSAHRPPAEDELPWTGRLFVAAGNTNNVYAVGVTASKDLQRLESVNVALTPRMPAGMTPSALALTPDQKRMFVVCSDANAAAVVDVSETRSRVEGFLPTGWYPTAARVLPDGRLVVLNGRGARSFPNLKGPDPTRTVARTHEGIRADQYTPSIQRGSASFIPPFDDRQLNAYSIAVLENSPYRDELLEDAGVPPGNPVPSRPGMISPIEHVVYIVKENRTYDQVFGGLEKGNGDRNLLLFGEDSSPNHHKLAREFVLFDNFYVNADVSADGHNWTTAAIAPDYVQKLWPNSYATRRRHYDYEAGDPAASPPAGYLWTNAAALGLSIRNYGYMVNNRAKPGADGVEVDSVRDATLSPVTNRHYRGFDMDYPDVERAKVFLKDLEQFESEGRMPRLILVRLGNDHTSGTAAGKIAPLAAMADNDYALGMIVEALSKSRFWPKMAAFILEDDAQNGADHVDSHRSPAFILSPYTRRNGLVDSSHYTTASMLRTIELILGLRPMTAYDAGARPMFAAFQAKPDTRPYELAKPRISLEERNPAGGPGAARSARLDFSEADRIDDNELNDILWRAIRKTEPPAPVRSIFSR